MADWSLPTLSSTYTNFLAEVKNRDVDLALQFDGTTSTNLATGTIRWNSSANTWQKWTGSAWGALSSTFAFSAITTTGTASIGGDLTVNTASGTATNLVFNQTAVAAHKFSVPASENALAYYGWNGSFVERFRVDSSGNFGIGTNSPSHRLEVSGSICVDGFSNSAVNYISLRKGFAPSNSGGVGFTAEDHSGSASDGLGCWGHDGIRFSTAQVERMRLDSSGRLGIGTSNPNEKLEVAGGIRASGALLTGSANSIAIDYSTNARIVSYGADTSTQGAFVFLGANSNASFSLERMRIDASGKLGIATASPAVTLDINAVDAVRIAAGTTAQRPTGAAGMIRYNSSLAQFEGYGTAWGTIGGGAKGAGSDQVFFENDQAVTANYTLTANKNAMTAGPVTVNAGITVTVPSGASWVIV
jgi:hypothetical protein